MGKLIILDIHSINAFTRQPEINKERDCLFGNTHIWWEIAKAKAKTKRWSHDDTKFVILTLPKVGKNILDIEEWIEDSTENIVYAFPFVATETITVETIKRVKKNYFSSEDIVETSEEEKTANFKFVFETTEEATAFGLAFMGNS